MVKWEKGAFLKHTKPTISIFKILNLTDIFIIWIFSKKDFWEFVKAITIHSDLLKLKTQIRLEEIRLSSCHTNVSNHPDLFLQMLTLTAW